EDFAEYLAHVTDYIQREKGIKISSLAPMNEPYTNYWYMNSPKQEGCHVSPGKRQSELLVATKKAMRRYNLDSTDLTASDETNANRAAKAFSALSPDALAVIDRVSTHTYEKATKKIGDLCRRTGIDLWMTETDWSSVSGEDAGEMSPALWLSEKIIEDVSVLRPSAWVIWQIVASYISKDGYMGRRDMDALFDLNKGYWGCAVAEIDRQEYILTQKYYAFGQFSRYIRPGMRLIITDKASLAAYDEEKDSLIIVAVNTKAEDEEKLFGIQEFSSLNCIRAVRTSGDSATGEKWAEVSAATLSDGTLAATLKGNSVTTFILTKKQ
ncbi:MAG: alpha-L-arabinofuranosidase, partial [Clostridia bacterium]|nr:alpha-L-arabinofuranosidase [Clostridia bacterium]